MVPRSPLRPVQPKAGPGPSPGAAAAAATADAAAPNKAIDSGAAASLPGTFGLMLHTARAGSTILHAGSAVPLSSLMGAAFPSFAAGVRASFASALMHPHCLREKAGLQAQALSCCPVGRQPVRAAPVPLAAAPSGPRTMVATSHTFVFLWCVFGLRCDAQNL